MTPRPKFSQLHDAEWLRSRYTGVHSATAIADEVGCSSRAVRAALVKHGIRAALPATQSVRKAAVEFHSATPVHNVCRCVRPWGTDGECLKCGKPVDLLKKEAA